jgi:hypothetical protein
VCPWGLPGLCCQWDQKNKTKKIPRKQNKTSQLYSAIINTHMEDVNWSWLRLWVCLALAPSLVAPLSLPQMGYLSCLLYNYLTCASHCNIVFLLSLWGQFFFLTGFSEACGVISGRYSVSEFLPKSQEPLWCIGTGQAFPTISSKLYCFLAN